MTKVGIEDIINLLRVRQWYKNVVVFAALLLTRNLFHHELLLKTIFGFIILCLVSSANYIFNDLIDYKRDRLHPEKRKRPIASGRITKLEAVLLMLFLFIISLMWAYKLDLLFFKLIILFVIITTLYSLWLKNEVILDVVLISINFVIRAASGAFLIRVVVSPWLILGIFFLAVFLVIGKREADLKVLGKKAYMHKKTLNHYTPRLTQALMIMSTTMLLIVYSLYTFSSDYPQLVLTIPIATYSLFYYYLLVENKSEIARRSELVFKEPRMLISMLLWLVIVFVLIYYNIKIPFLKVV